MKKQVFDFWRKGSADDLKTAEILFEKKRYLPCLFFCHLAIEKLIKAIIVQKNLPFQPIHNLARLAKIAKIDLPENIKEELLTISEFNIRARYDDYKTKLHQKADERFTAKYLQMTKELIKWFKKIL